MRRPRPRVKDRCRNGFHGLPGAGVAGLGRTRRIEPQLVTAESIADVAEDPGQHSPQHHQRDDEDRAADAEADQQSLAAAGLRVGILGISLAEAVRRRRSDRLVDGLDELGAIGDRGGLLQQVQQRRRATDPAALLHGAGRRRRDLERNLTVDRARFDRLSGGIEFGGFQTAAHARLAQRPLVDQQRVQRGADTADVIFGVASGRVAGNASATSPSMLTRTRLG